MLIDNDFMKWLTLKAFIINGVSHAIKIAFFFFVFLNEMYFLLTHFYFKCNLNKKSKDYKRLLFHRNP